MSTDDIFADWKTSRFIVADPIITEDITMEGMQKKFNSIKDFFSGDAQKTLNFNLADNPVAKNWYAKLKKIYRLPLCELYTTSTEILSINEINKLIASDVIELNELMPRSALIDDNP